MKLTAPLLALVLLAGGATARADTTQPGTYAGPPDIDAGPVLMGDRVAWAVEADGTRSDDEQRWVTTLYSAPAAGGAAQPLASIAERFDDGSYPYGSNVTSLTGAPGHLAWATYSFDASASKYGYDVPNAFRMFALDPAGRPAEICRTGNHESGVALAGAALGVGGCGGVTVRDLAQPGSAPDTLAPDGGLVRLAGTYAAWSTSTGYELLNRATGARTTFDATSLPTIRRQFAVSPEGVLVVAIDSPRNSQIAWASAEQPAWHTFRVPGLVWTSELRVRDGRIALLAYTRATDRLELSLADLSGARTLIAERQLGAEGLRATDFDFDGTYVAWAGTTCDALTVTVRAIADGKVTLPARSHCPVAINPAAARVSRRGAAIGLRCPAPSVPRASDRCAGSVVVRRTDGRRIGNATFRLKLGAWGTARVRLTASARRTLARRDRLRVEVAVRSVTRGRPSRTTTQVDLRR